MDKIQEQQSVTESVHDTPMRDSEAVVKRAKDFFQNSLSFLELNNHEITWIDLNQQKKVMEFNDLFKHCEKQYLDRKYQEVAKNCYMIIQSISAQLKLIKKNIEGDFRDLVREFDNMSGYLEGYENDIRELEAELSAKDLEIKRLNEDQVQSKFANHQQQLDNMRMMMISMASGKVLPQEHFDSEILNNSQKLLDEQVSKSSPIVENKSEHHIEDIKSEVPKSRKDKLQKVHEEVLDFAKRDELYPLHKINLIEALGHYRNAWELICFKHGLEEKDLPKFIHSLDLYKDKPNDYLDILAEIEEIE
jgi:hypothetical protein